MFFPIGLHMLTAQKRSEKAESRKKIGEKAAKRSRKREEKKTEREKKRREQKRKTGEKNNFALRKEKEKQRGGRYEKEEACNGQEAVDMVKSSAPGYYDLVLMDIQMPVMDGYEATKEIRRLPNPLLANLPIVAMTANAFEEEKRQALSCGMNGHITKPINVAVLFDTIMQILKSNQ